MLSLQSINNHTHKGMWLAADILTKVSTRRKRLVDGSPILDILGSVQVGIFCMAAGHAEKLVLRLAIVL